MPKVNYEKIDFLLGCDMTGCLGGPFDLPCVTAVESATKDPEFMSVSDRDLWRNVGFTARQACPQGDQPFAADMAEKFSRAVVEARQVERDGTTREVEL